MKFFDVIVAVLFSTWVSHSDALSSASFSDLDKNRPISKVITLLKDMLKQLEKEAEEDEAIYDKMACWCKTNDKEKSQSIKDAEAHIELLTGQIEQHTATSGRLNAELVNHEKELKESQDALDKAQAIRDKERAEFNGEEKDLMQSVSALKAAITVLSKHHDGSLLQVPPTHLLSVGVSMQRALDTHKDMLEGVLTPKEMRTAMAFIQAPEDFFSKSPTFKQSYAPQSGEIFGILRQMLETFESNLSASQKEELAAQKAFEDLKAAKLDEIAAEQNQLDTKTAELASTDEKLEQGKVEKEDTKSSLSADEQFLMMLKEKCQMTDQEWEERQKTRQDEMTAVSKALEVLSSDDSHDLFTRTFNPAFVQTASSPRMSAMATKAQLDSFTRVKKAIDDMIAQLLKQKDDEIKHKDFCTKEFNDNGLQTEGKQREITDISAHIGDLDGIIQQLKAQLDALKKEIAEMQVQLKRAGEDREKENKVFQTVLADQRETQRLLKKAHEFLADFYHKSEASLVQAKDEPVGPPPPAGFDSYTKNQASGGVLSMIQQIISDAKAMEAETVRAESDAQKAYEDFVKDTNGSIDQKNKEIVNLSDRLGQAEADHVEAHQDQDSANLDMEQLSNYNAQLHSSCDFVMKNFDVRQTARDEEVEALRQAKAILSGARFEEFLQSA